jgi:CRP-like cAMP-binding protein
LTRSIPCAIPSQVIDFERIAKNALRLLAPNLSQVRIDESLVFIVDPAFNQLALVYAESEQSLHLDGSAVTLESLYGDDQSKVLTRQHIANRNELTIRFLPYLFQNRQASRFSAMGSRKRVATKVMEYDLFVVTIYDRPQVVLDPRIRISLDDGINVVIWD